MLHAYRYIRCSMWAPFCAKYLCSRSTQLFITLIRILWHVMLHLQLVRMSPVFLEDASDGTMIHTTFHWQAASAACRWFRKHRQHCYAGGFISFSYRSSRPGPIRNWPSFHEPRKQLGNIHMRHRRAIWVTFIELSCYSPCTSLPQVLINSFLSSVVSGMI